MKRLISALLLTALLVMAFPVSGSAVDNDIIYFADGGYIIKEISIIKSREAGTVTGNNTYTYYDNNGDASWKAVLSGAFSYNGSSATCTASSCDVTIYDSAWYIVSKSASKSGNTATALVTMGYKTLGVAINKVPININLSCDANGNLS